MKQDQEVKAPMASNKDPEVRGNRSGDVRTNVPSIGKTSLSGISPETDEILERVDHAMGQNPRRRARRFASNLLIVGGILLIVVPLIMTAISMKRNADAMDAFLNDTSGVVDNAQSSAENVDSFYSEAVDFTGIAGQDGTVDPAVSAGPPANGADASVTGSAVTDTGLPTDTTAAAVSAAPAGPTKKPLMSKEEIQKRMIGVLYIDKIDVRMPVMTGVDDETLRVAAGRMPESGKLDKIGNVVLAGHRSYTFGKYFNRLDEMKVGDTFKIKTGKKTLEYKVFKVFIVEPDDFSILNYNKTDKICTLFTCHPIVIANKRLVVQGIQTN